ncbi:MAG: glyceraldehyde-3-phosphate dehydrogenase [Nitrospirales bacterium]|nr:MAG: glyceraldehyde-3-phosphate dehydrogenase [Nitrospirales bacterium]
MAKVAINGLGRIGRATCKLILDDPTLELVAINDLAAPEELGYLLQYDTVYGRYEKPIIAEKNRLIIDGLSYACLSEKEPNKLPWRKLGVDLVFECTGIFNQKEQLESHLHAGAKRVIISAPIQEESIPMVVHGVNRPDEKDAIISCASCTTNCITPIIEILGRHLGLKKAALTTIHAYTATQSLVDAPNKKLRRGRAGAENCVPSSTGAAKATTHVLPQYQDKFDGLAIRTPIPAGSLADIVSVTERSTTVEEVNNIFKDEACSDRYQGILSVTKDPIVSSDIIREPYATIIDLELTKVIDGDLVKIMSWYDNEWGYACQMVREARRLLTLAEPSLSTADDLK